jgi:hypothetical protein
VNNELESIRKRSWHNLRLIFQLVSAGIKEEEEEEDKKQLSG